MHISNLPLVLTSVCVLTVPYFYGLQTNNLPIAIAWGGLSVSSIFLHITKRPYHLYGHANCIPFFFWMDQAFIYASLGTNIYNATFLHVSDQMVCLLAIAFAGTLFFVGRYTNSLSYDKRWYVNVPSHMMIHIVTAGATTYLVQKRTETLS